MIRFMFAFLFALLSTFCVAADEPVVTADKPAAVAVEPAKDVLPLAKNAPQTYTVVPGDTLWDVAGKFLQEPWRWPEIWRMNKEQIKNPARIYPGDVIALEHDANGKPFLRIRNAATGSRSGRDSQSGSRDIKLEPQIYSDQNGQGIPPIRPDVIEPFISVPLVVEEKILRNAASIVATAQDRVFLSKGDIAYVQGADPSKEFWQIYRDVKPLPDPENPKRVLGYEAFYLGTAKQTHLGDPATFEILSAKEEIGRGDRLIPSARPPLVDYVPHKPDFPLEGRVVSIYGVPVHGTIGTAGMGSVVSVNRGQLDGIEVGHVLALERNRTIFVQDDQNRRTSVKTPSERTGLLFIFRTFDRISYALVVHAEGVVEVNDFVRTP